MRDQSRKCLVGAIVPSRNGHTDSETAQENAPGIGTALKD